MSDIQLRARQEQKLIKLERNLMYQQRKNDIRTQYMPESVFNMQNPSMNPYMQQQQMDPMQGILDMITQLMPLVAMGIIPKEALSDMFGGMFGQTTSTSGEKLGKADENGWREVLETETEVNPEDESITATGENVKTYKNKAGDIRTVSTDELDNVTTVITSADEKTITTTKKNSDGKLLLHTIKKNNCFVVNDGKTETTGQETDPKYDYVEFIRDEKGKRLEKIKLGEGKDQKTYTRTEDIDGKKIFLAPDNKTKYVLSNSNKLILYNQKP